jgi:hypothetical protein
VTYSRSVVFSIQHYVIKFVSDLQQVGGFLYTTLFDKVCQWLTAGRWFCPGTVVFTTIKTDRHDITEILLKVVLNTITLTLTFSLFLREGWGLSKVVPEVLRHGRTNKCTYRVLWLKILLKFVINQNFNKQTNFKSLNEFENMLLTD